MIHRIDSEYWNSSRTIQSLQQRKMMHKSESIAKIGEALSKAQLKMEPASKDSTNPFFHAAYSSLASVIEAIRVPFGENGLSFVQCARSIDKGIEVETVLMHTSGEWISETLALPVSKNDAQAIGSAITYAKRYGIQAMAGVPSDDDDGNTAAASPGHKQEKPAAAKQERAADKPAEKVMATDAEVARMITDLMGCPTHEALSAMRGMVNTIISKCTDDQRATILESAKARRAALGPEPEKTGS